MKLRQWFGVLITGSYAVAINAAILPDNLWLTPDQKGAQLLTQGNAKQAAETFDNKEWQGIAEFKSGQYQKAVKTFEQITPKSNKTYYNLGNALAHTGQYEKAIAAYKEALKLNPKDADAQHNKKLLEEMLKKEQDKKDKSNKQQQKDKSKEQDNKDKSKDQDNKDKSKEQDNKDKSKDQDNKDKSKEQDNKDKSKDQDNKDKSKEQDNKDKSKDQDNKDESKEQDEQNNQDKAKDQVKPKQQNKKDASPDPAEPNQPDQADQNKPNQPSQSMPQDKAAKENDNKAAQATSALPNKNREKQQAQMQQLKRVPDNPGGLLRQNFLLHIRLLIINGSRHKNRLFTSIYII
jgi:Ca-activated chloride channel family protein